MEHATPDDPEVRDLRSLVERIKRGDCVLVLGPRVAIRANDSDRRPLDELLACELVASIDAQRKEASVSTLTLRSAADLHYRIRQDRVELELAVQDFYARDAGSTTVFHRDLARLPFRLCVSASPDSLMLTAFREANKSPQEGYYSFRQAINAPLAVPTPATPLVYSLFGYHEAPSSLVLTEGDLIEFLVSIVRGTPPVPDRVRSILADPAVSFLFLGFGFHNWYLRVLLQVMNVYGHRSKAIAFEDPQFFDHPEHEQVVGFFSGDRLIDFRPLRWEVFAQRLREVYDAGAPSKPPEPEAKRDSRSGTTPKAFISYASEDRAAVHALAEALERRGIAVWQDTQDLRAGDDWNRVLLDVIAHRVDYVVVLQTPAMTTAIRGVFHREIEAAQQRQAEMGEFDAQRLRFLVPVTLGASERLSALKNLHTVDVGEEAGMDSLAASILEDWKRRAALRSRGDEPK